MDRLKLLSVALVVALCVSIGFVVYVESQNVNLVNQKNVLNDENNSQRAQLEMVSVLSQVQVQVSAELQKIGDSLVYACGELSAIGLEGDGVRAVLSALAANSSFIIEASTSDLNNVLITVEPRSYSNFEGKYIGEQDYVNTNSRDPIRPVMTTVIPLVEGFNGSVIVAPVFSLNGTRIGAVGVVFDPGELINDIVAPAVVGYPFTMWTTQTDGLVIYDADPAQRGLMLFSDEAYADYSQMLTVMHQIVDESSGHNIYHYLKTLASGQLVSKEAFWTTVSAYSVEWRMVIVHVLDE